MSRILSRKSLSLAAPWDVMDLESGSSMLDDVADDGFLLQFTSGGSSEASDVTLGLSDESESEHQEELPSLYKERSYSPDPEEDIEESRRVTPDSSESSEAKKMRKKSTTHCIKRQYRHSFKKLAKSMRQSDATRSMIKRQKRLLKEDKDNFFSSPRCFELEAARRKLFNILASCK